MKRTSLADAFAKQKEFAHVVAVCPHCGAVSTFTCGQPMHFSLGATVMYQHKDVASLHIAVCPGCKGPVFAFHYRHGPAEVVWPHPLPPDMSPPDLDAEFKKSYDEARAVLAISPMASAVLARRCVQHVLEMKMQVRKGKLNKEIEEAVGRSELSMPTRGALDHVRKIGNWAAHPDLDQGQTIIDVSPEDAVYTLQVLEMLFDDLYVKPQQIAAMSAAIQGKK